MTGFAAVSRESAGARIQVTAKSVNHRFLDVALKAPSSLAVIESRLRALVQQRLARGRLELAVSLEIADEPPAEVVVNHAIVARVVESLAAMKERGIIAGDLTPGDILRIPKALEVRERREMAGDGPGEAILSAVEGVVADAVDALIVMRETEGRFIGTDLDGRLATIAGFVNTLEEESRAGQAHLEARLRERLESLPADLAGDAAAMGREVVRFVARSDVDEEIVRMRSHLDHWRSLVGAAEPCGRKLDFLVQEMNREINTIGSKVESARASELVIAAKAELERIREQVQNVE
jgi:uncharacterized protein (TIGR00255 family)